MWYETFDAIFWTGIGGLVIGGAVIGIKLMYKSKCSSFSCCFGCLNIQRDTAAEEEIDMKFGVALDETKQDAPHRSSLGSMV